MSKIKLSNDFKIEIAQKIDILQDEKDSLVKKAKSYKLYMGSICALSLAVAYIYVLVYSKTAIGSYIAISAIIVTMSIFYFTLNPVSLLSQNRVNYFKDIYKRDLYRESLKSLYPDIYFNPIYRTNLRFINNSGLFNKTITEAKEEDGIVIKRKYFSIHISVMLLFHGMIPEFRGLFCMIEFSDLNYVDVKNFNLELLKRTNVVSVDNILYSLKNNRAFIGLEIDRQLFDLELKMGSIKKDNILEDLQIIITIIDSIESITTLNNCTL